MKKILGLLAYCVFTTLAYLVGYTLWIVAVSCLYYDPWGRQSPWWIVVPAWLIAPAGSILFVLIVFDRFPPRPKNKP